LRAAHPFGTMSRWRQRRRRSPRVIAAAASRAASCGTKLNHHGPKRRVIKAGPRTRAWLCRFRCRRRLASSRCVNIYMYTCIHTYMYTHIHTYIHTYIQGVSSAQSAHRRHHSTPVLSSALQEALTRELESHAHKRGSVPPSSGALPTPPSSDFTPREVIYKYIYIHM
jgi:hypothetical protein